MVICGFIVRLLRPGATTGFINDVYFLIYYFSIAWFIYGFEKVYRPRLSRAQQIMIALLMSLVANYITDVIWYFLYGLYLRNGYNPQFIHHPFLWNGGYEFNFVSTHELFLRNISSTKDLSYQEYFGEPD